MPVMHADAKGKAKSPCLRVHEQNSLGSEQGIRSQHQGRIILYLGPYTCYGGSLMEPAPLKQVLGRASDPQTRIIAFKASEVPGARR
jgi:hypothetical protein